MLALQAPEKAAALRTSVIRFIISNSQLHLVCHRQEKSRKRCGGRLI
jgi:hypothetical protein